MFLKRKASPADPTAASPKRRMPKSVLIGIGVIIIAGSLVGLRATQAKKDDAKPRDPVLEFTPADVTVVESRSLERALQISGSLAPLVQSTVRSKVSGEVQGLLVREGDSVAAGQLMARIDTADLQSRLDSQVALLEENRARQSIAEKNRENNMQLLRQKFISQNAFDTAHSTFEASAAAVRSTEAQVRIAKKAMEDALVRSPIHGIVARKMVTTGEKVNIDTPLFSVVDLSRMEIEAPAPAAEIPGIKAGQVASLRVDGYGERVFEGRVERINPAADPGSRTITLYLSIPNTDGALKGGMFAKGSLVLEKRPPAFVVPTSALREEAGQAYVYTIESGKVARRSVTVGARDAQAGLVEIRTGVDKGLSVVSARVTGLKPGSPAVIKSATAPKAASAPKAAALPKTV